MYVVANIAECTIVVLTLATRKGRKSGRIVENKVAADISVGGGSSPTGGSSKGFVCV
jgi:hypothetical protein